MVGLRGRSRGDRGGPGIAAPPSSRAAPPNPRDRAHTHQVPSPPSLRNKSMKGDSFERANRRRGRPASASNPDLSPLHDGNYDRLSECGAGGEGTGWWRVFFQFSFPLRSRRETTPARPPTPSLPQWACSPSALCARWPPTSPRPTSTPTTGSSHPSARTPSRATRARGRTCPGKHSCGRCSQCRSGRPIRHGARSDVRPRCADGRRPARDGATGHGHPVPDCGRVGVGFGGDSEENALLLREAAAASLALTVDHPFDSAGSESEGGE